MGLLLLVLLVLVLVGAFPRWGYNKSWGYWPTGVVGLLLVVVLVLVLVGTIPHSRFAW